MIRAHDIKWFLEDPMRLVMMKPFTRGGRMELHAYEQDPDFRVTSTQLLNTGFTQVEKIPISQDRYIMEYRPDLHHIILNKTIPHIQVRINGEILPINMMELTQTASFQKLIHAAHVRNLTANKLEFTMLNKDADESERKAFDEIKQEWEWRGLEQNKYDAISDCKKLGNCALLFEFDKDNKKYFVRNFSYEDGYQFVSNKDEYGFEIARSMIFTLENTIVIDTYDNTTHYRCTQTKDGWKRESEPHGYSRNPLLINRGTVAWEYAESSIEMWELLKNIGHIALKRFGTFALAFWGEMDTNSFKRDSSTLIINLSSDTTNGKQDAKVLDFPEPNNLETEITGLERDISLFSSTSFITPKDISSTQSGGNGIALAMSNDYALATQSAMAWKQFVNDMVFLHQEGLDNERNQGTVDYAKVKIGANIIPWSLETANTKLVNLGLQAPYLSTRTLIEKCPDAAPDEAERVTQERGDVLRYEGSSATSDADKAQRVATNRNDIIRDNQ